MIDLAKQSQKKVFVMHSLSVPAKTDEFISEQINPISYLKAWWAEKRQSCLDVGLLDENLIFDLYKINIIIILFTDVQTDISNRYNYKNIKVKFENYAKFIKKAKSYLFKNYFRPN